MHTRKHTVGRNILRVFEIALFFVVSVLGYGLMLKTSSFNGKSKSRVHTPGLQSTPDQKGNNRELNVIPVSLIFPNETAAISTNHSGLAHPVDTFHALPSPAILTAVRDCSLQYHNAPDRTPLPHNLLQQNPVLLI
ncbi:hypothetical protein FGF66_01545 [Chlorobaculum thiosulfatiphilum]|jgi:hypothetical protein|uniref:Uncharacterized protein n=1 Tax=Chlorobaculum thiosulfatiphilum TaxID=115852 RepID=A0A5C4SA20_CHLTI|nr:hypothetical protein [Chlorobaculum thiosulfatiphilum]TNJ40008.1 hypothetical protein FGF66_01545 [Chlorobaculum thiosulfatiphilum]